MRPPMETQVAIRFCQDGSVTELRNCSLECPVLHFIRFPIGKIRGDGRWLQRYQFWAQLMRANA